MLGSHQHLRVLRGNYAEMVTAVFSLNMFSKQFILGSTPSSPSKLWCVDVMVAYWTVYPVARVRSPYASPSFVASVDVEKASSPQGQSELGLINLVANK